jgi:hypothetical protein
LWLSCTQIKPEAPISEAFEKDIEQKMSHISMPIIFEIKKIEARINKELKGVIYHDNSFENHHKDNVKITVKKEENIKISIKNNVLYYKIPLRIWLEARLEKKLIGKAKIKKVQAVEMAVRLKFKSVLAVGQDWKLQTKTTFMGLEWIKQPEIKVAMIRVNLATKTEKILLRKQKEIERKIDKVARNQITIKDKIQKIWQELQNPILFNKKEYKAWLKMTPQNIELGKIKGNGGFLKIFLKINTQITTLFGNNPKHTIIKKIPPLVINHKIKDDFQLYVFSNVLYEELNQIAKSKLKNKEIPIEGYKVIIKKVEISGSGRNLIIKVKIKGDIKSTVYFRGVPFYDKERQELQIKEFDFDLKTEESLLQGAEWLLHDIFKEYVQEALHVPLKDKLNKIPELIQNGIKKGKIGEKIELKLENFVLKPDKILVAEKGLKLMIDVRGNSSLKLKQI